ncbi:MAG: exosortase-dependent surface protein XDP2 [Pseudomonadota bacterium]
MGGRPVNAASSLRILAVLAVTVLLRPGDAQAVIPPDQLVVTSPPNTNNSAGAGTETCTLGGGASCTGTLSTGAVTDDLQLDTIIFGAVTFDGAAGEIIPGLASVFVEGGGGTNVNAEWGDDDDNDDGDDTPFEKAGYPIPPATQETSDIDIIDATLRTVFRTLNLAEGIDGEDQDFRINLEFERGVVDNDGSMPDPVPEIIVFERGLNSDVSLILLLADGGESDELEIDRGDFVSTGFRLNTIEIGGDQILGVVGVDLNEFSGAGFDPASDVVIGVRFGSAGGGADIFGVYGTSEAPVLLEDFGDAPSTYATEIADNGPRHALSNALYIGRTPQFGLDGLPSALADAAPDEVAAESITLPTIGTPIGPGDTYSIDVLVTNLTGGPALLCGWVDFDDDGVFANTDSGVGLVDAERACVAVSDGSLSTGFTPTEVTLDFILPFNTASPPDDNFISRFRITDDWTVAADASPLGQVGAGEIEDHRISSAGTLPVSIVSFESQAVPGGVEVRWSTASETHNVGFKLWADRGEGLELLTTNLIPSFHGDAAMPQAYRHVLEGERLGELGLLALSAIDYRGVEEFYGWFEPRRSFGAGKAVSPINWARSRDDAAEVRARRIARAAESVSAADVTPAESGLVEVSYGDLLAGGLDLREVAVDRIAVTLKGEPVPRDVFGGTVGADGRTVFGPGAGIRFWADRPTFPDAVYLEQYRYRIADDPAGVMPAELQSPGEALFASGFERPLEKSEGAGSYQAIARHEQDSSYNFATPRDDPWSAALLRADRNSEYAAVFELSGVVPTGSAELTVALSGLTDFPEVPDHHVHVRFNGVDLGESFFDGTAPHDLTLAVPPGVLASGTNTVAVLAPGGTVASFDLFLLDTIALRYERELEAADGRLHVPAQETASVLRIPNLAGTVVAYARSDHGLVRLEHRAARGGGVEVAGLAGEAEYWFSSTDRVVRPAAVDGVADVDLLAGAEHDFIVIAHPAFLPSGADAGGHPLEDYLALRRAEGWRVGVYAIDAIQRQFGWGMALPDAVTRFLAAADRRMAYEHVLLIGGDSYDYRDRLGLGSISHIPTRYAPTTFVRHTPGDALLADLDGDGLADKAVGRWPVRSLGDLQSIVAKTLAWESVRALRSSVWLTDAEDPFQSSFEAQADRMLVPLLGARWQGPDLDRIHFDQVLPDPGLSVADTARRQLFDRIEAGRTLTGFVGHGSPSVWTFQGLLSPNDLAELDNEGSPTLITTMTCYTSYFVSPRSDTVAHRWMNGYGEDASGAPLIGRANGAVAVNGAATLSSYLGNERFAREVLKQQLDGRTLGQAMEQARGLARARGAVDQVINWTLLGDPTLRLE